MDNSTAIRDLRAAQDAAEGVRLANGLREVFAAHLSSEDYLLACVPLDEIKERAGTDPAVHERKAKRLLNQLVISNEGLVCKIAMRTTRIRHKDSEDFLEAVQEGRMGLVRAIEAYDESRGSFSTCAGFWIRHYVQNCMHKQKHFAKQRSACMPAPVAVAVNRFRTLHGREPEPQEVGQTQDDWERWADRAHVVSVEEMMTDKDSEYGGGNGASELIVDERENPDAVAASVQLTGRLGEEMAAMSPRNRDITKALFIDGRQLSEVAGAFGLSPTRMHQLKAQLEKRLRKALSV